MVERIQEGMAAPIPETKFRVLETTLAGLGLDTSFDNLNLAADRFTLGVKKDGEDTVYVGLLKHPFAGGHFVQFLNNVSPFPDQDRDGIIDDVNLPILAQADYQKVRDRATSESIRLHERHLNDPRVEPAYIRFVEDHVNSWLKALEINTGLRVFETLQRIKFINNVEEARKELFSDNGNPISSFLDTFRGFYIEKTLQNFQNDRFRLIYEDFLRKGMGRKEGVEAILKSLTKKDQGEFAISYFVNWDKQIFVDLETNRILRDKSQLGDPFQKVPVKFADNGRDVVVGNNTGTRVVVSPTGQNSERFNWKAIEYQFSKNYTKFSLYPVIAWKRDANGTRTFLTQQEAMQYVMELGLPEGGQGDVKLGEIGVAYFARHIIKDWPAKMRLAPLEGDKKLFRISRHDDFEQPMRGGQMPAWVGVEQHKAELLKTETSILARSEKHLVHVA